MSFSRYVLMVTLGILLLPWQSKPASADGTAIRWEVENRFRYFIFASDFRAIAKVYDDLKAANPSPSALQLERALEDRVSNGQLTGLVGLDKHDGWAASIVERSCGKEQSVSGRSRKHDHRSCEMKNGDSYLNPTKADILVRAQGLGSTDCEWWMDGTEVGKVACNGGVVRIKDVSYGEQHTLEVRPKNALPQRVQVTLKDALIVSFGDSFSAGEGNPEKPVRLQQNTYSDYGSSAGLGKYFPVRQDLTNVKSNEQTEEVFFQDLAPVWTNSQCHQSLYSQHTKAALQYALEHPHLTVTYMNYSCTGAGVYEGILNAWWARDDVEDGNYDDAPQIVKALRDLCSDQSSYRSTKWAIHSRIESNYDRRPAVFPACHSFVRRRVDAVLMSIGGNDVGFANMIANAAVDVPTTGQFAKGRSWIYGIWRAATGPQTFDTGLQLADQRIAARYGVLDQKLRDNLPIDSGKVVLSAYPNINADVNGDLCKPNNLGMDVHPIFGIYNSKTWSDSSKFVGKFHDIMGKAAKDLHWKFADQHISLPGSENHFVKDANGKGHGICAVSASETAAETMLFPRPKRHTVPPMDWKPSQPELWSSYSDRTRWFVTPNDSFLTTNYHDAEMPSVMDPVQPLYAATLSGSFHPNALGHAAIADSVLIKLREVLMEFETDSSK